jgi:prepilin-type N-terminal cleavage/methylation domain-containing protein
MKRAGTSLVELLIALTIFSIFAASMTMIVVKSSVTDKGVDARREARGVARSALNILESELRMAEPSGVIAQTDDSTITFREPIAFGLVCDATVAIGGAATISLLPSADVPSSLSITGYSGWAYRDPTGTYQYVSNTTLASGANGTCQAGGVITLLSSSARVVSVSGALDALTRGQVAFLYRQIKYSLRESSALPGRRGLFRTAGANGTPVEVAAPFGAGARFRWYILDNPIVQDTLPTDFEDLAGVQFVLTAESRNTPRYSTAPVSAPFTTSIFFQNRPN